MVCKSGLTYKIACCCLSDQEKQGKKEGTEEGGEDERSPVINLTEKATFVKRASPKTLTDSAAESLFK